MFAKELSESMRYRTVQIYSTGTVCELRVLCMHSFQFEKYIENNRKIINTNDFQAGYHIHPFHIFIIVVAVCSCVPFALYSLCSEQYFLLFVFPLYLYFILFIIYFRLLDTGARFCIAHKTQYRK